MRIQLTVGAGDTSTEEHKTKWFSFNISFVRFCSLCWRVPPQIVSVHQQCGRAVLGTANVLLNLLRLHTHHILSLPVLDHVEGLQRADDVLLCKGRHFTGGGGGYGVEGCRAKGTGQGNCIHLNTQLETHTRTHTHTHERHTHTSAS